MSPNSAYDLINIVVGTDYSPVATSIPYPANPSSGIMVNGPVTAPVYALFCTASNTGTTTITTLAGNTVDVPAGAFKQGVVYYIYLGILVADGGGSFIGYKYTGLPTTL